MTVKEQLIGTWRLISQETEFPDGHKEHTRGQNPDGILMYDVFGNMSVHLSRTEEPLNQHTDITVFETVMAEYHAYFGTYEIDEDARIVYHHIVSAVFPPYRGTRQVRHFELDGDELRLYAAATTAGDDTKRFLIWHRLTKAYTE